MTTLIGGLAVAGALGSQSHVRRNTASGRSGTLRNILGRELAETWQRPPLERLGSRCDVIAESATLHRRQAVAGLNLPGSRLARHALS
jgi:hypothetical protein